MRRSTEVAALFVMLWSRLGVAGPLPPAPTAVALGPQAKHDDLGQRRSIRGATVEVHESEELRALRRFEEDRFGPARARDIGGARGASDAGNPIGTGGSGGGGGARDTAATDEANAFAGLNLPDIPVRNDSHLLGFLELYKSERRGHAIMSAWLKRQGRYRELIETALDRHHLPRALLYVAMIESGYDPHDKSSVGASGVWQFMPAGAQIYGLRMDYWVDERDDPEKATDAVMRYFDDLHAHFGT